mmetsp:Transcript_29814/g.72049  ORF Transcript_29814/g.72049 Transcript_29814/m.72049 type:complete len:511 (-) Transcript_29814:294-1826(-)
MLAALVLWINVIRVHSLWKVHGEVDRNGFAPVTLTGEDPITEFVSDFRTSGRQLLKLGCDGLLGLVRLHAVKFAAVHIYALIGKSLLLRHIIGTLLRLHDPLDIQSEFGSKFKVTIVMGRHGHDSPCPIRSQHIVTYPNGYLFICQWVDGITAREHACLFLGGGTVQVRARRCGGYVSVNFFLLVWGCYGRDKRMFGRESYVGNSIYGVSPGGEDRYFLILHPIDPKIDLCPRALSDPLFLRGHRTARPVQSLQPRLEPVRVLRNLQHPLPQRQSFHGMIPALAQPVDHLLVRQHRPQRRTPVHGHRALLRQSQFVQLEEYPLRPLHVSHVGGGDLLLPIVRESEHLQLAFEVGDVLRRGDLWMRAGVYGVLLGGEAEGIPSDGVEDIVGCHSPVACHHVGCGVSLRMTDMQPRPARIGKHIQHVLLLILTFDDGSVLLGGTTIRRRERFVFLPVGLPFGLDVGEGISRRGGSGSGGGIGRFLRLLDGIAHVPAGVASERSPTGSAVIDE